MSFPAAVIESSASIFLTPYYRFAGDDWSGSNALGFVVYDVAPTYDDQGNVLTSGIARPLAGCSVVGTARYQTRCTGPAPSNAPTPVALTGAVVDADAGLISLSAAKALTGFPRQDPALWNAGAPDPRRALLLIQPCVVGADGAMVSIGLQPLFVF